MKILYFVSNPQRMAGSNRGLYNLVTNLPPHIKPIVLFTDEGHGTTTFRNSTCEVHVIRPEGYYMHLYGKRILRIGFTQFIYIFFREYLPYAIKLFKFLSSDRDIKIVYVHDARALFLIGIAAKLANKKVVYHIRTEYQAPKKVWFFLRYIPDVFFSLAHYMKNNLDHHSKVRTHVVHDGIKDISALGTDIPYLRNLRDRGYIVLGCVATIIPFKGLHYLIEACNEIKVTAPEIYKKLIIVCIGDLTLEHRPYQQWIAQKIETYQLDNITFTGWQNDTYSFYRSVDFTVLPSVSNDKINFGNEWLQVIGNEGLPVTHIEAMMYSLPVIGTDIAGVQEIIKDGYNGFLIPPNDVKSLAASIIKLSSDGALRGRMGCNGRRTVLDSFQIDRYVDNVVRVYERLMPTI